MRLTGVLERIVGAATRRPTRVLAIAVLIAVAGSVLALALLRPSAGTETLVSKSSDTFAATERHRETFGDHSVIVLVRGDLAEIMLTKNLGRLIGLEGCLSGNKPAEVKEIPGGPTGPCARLQRSKPVQVVYGPGTFVNSSVGEITKQFQGQLAVKAKEAKDASEAARKLALGQGRSKSEAEQFAKSAADAVQAQLLRDLLEVAVKYGLRVDKGLPRVNDPDFVSTLVFDARRCATCPKARFAYLFPNKDSAAIQVRFKPSLSEDEREQAIDDVRAAVAMDLWKLEKASYLVTGAPVVVADLADALSGSLLRLFVLALLVMALVLALAFRARLRLLPLFVALAAVGATFGLLALVGGSLTMASIAVLPVLLGLGVDYAIQFQARVQADGLERAARVALPTIATAAAATVTGFAVLLLSPVPMVQGFGALLMVGIVLALVFALSAGTAALVLASRRLETGGHEPGREASHSETPLGPVGRDGAFVAAVRGAGEMLSAAVSPLAGPAHRVGRFARRIGTGALRLALARPGRVLAVGFALALAGWGVDSQTEVVSDIRELVPAALVGDLVALQEVTDVSGEIDVLVEADDIGDPKVVGWMRGYQERLLKRFGYSETKGCGQAELCPALSLTDLFRNPAATKDRAAIKALLDAVPAYFSQAVITPDRRTAALAFGVKLMELDRQKEVIDVMRDELDPPAGVRAELAGLPVLAAEANAALSAPARRLGVLVAGLALVALALFLIYRRWDRAWVPLVPIALATGWSALVLFVLRVPLNPMSATLGALVIAISTEFSVLLAARYREERAAGHSVEDALRRTYTSTGAVVLASGATAIAGFAVLAFSDVRMLQQFGLVTVVDLTASLLGVMAVLPAVLVLAERRAAAKAPVGAAGASGAGSTGSTGSTGAMPEPA